MSRTSFTTGTGYGGGGGYGSGYGSGYGLDYGSAGVPLEERAKARALEDWVVMHCAWESDSYGNPVASLGAIDPNTEVSKPQINSVGESDT